MEYDININRKGRPERIFSNILRWNERTDLSPDPFESNGDGTPIINSSVNNNHFHEYARGTKVRRNSRRIFSLSITRKRRVIEKIASNRNLSFKWGRDVFIFSKEDRLIPFPRRGGGGEEYTRAEKKRHAGNGRAGNRVAR